MFQKIVLFFVITTVGASVDSDKITRKLNPHIVGGNDAHIEDYPFIVSIRIYGKHYCGGSIYSPKIIITAAHCLLGEFFFLITVHAGSSSLTHEKYIRTVRKEYKHPQFKPLAEYDIGILILKKDLIFNEFVQPIPLAKSQPPPDSLVNVIGWGYKKEHVKKNSDILQVAVLNTVSHEDCANAYKGASVIKPRVLCAISPDDPADACQNDSGGPLIFENQLLGLVSYGNGCARKGFPGIYTSIPDLYDWITTTVKKHRNKKSRRPIEEDT